MLTRNVLITSSWMFLENKSSDLDGPRSVMVDHSTLPSLTLHNALMTLVSSNVKVDKFDKFDRPWMNLLINR